MRSSRAARSAASFSTQPLAHTGNARLGTPESTEHAFP